MSVLDVGCGTGAITADIARIVGPNGYVLGFDRDESLLHLARRDHMIPNLRFVQGDILTFPLEGRFDVVTAARTLQWVSSPEAAISQMRQAARSGGKILVLDYNHDNNSWEPDPPNEFTRFYKAFVEWRRVNGWNNRMADCLPALFQSQGLQDILVHMEDELARRGDPDFSAASSIWVNVLETIGPQLIAAGFLAERERMETESVYRDWVQDQLQIQTLQMRAVEATVP
ncbi:MAG: methyltransferase domain-containing protein [Acidobacteriaceae bacterium]|nr:methyltransferase domain-containing protein [Acidobacteriaceae bacterium]